MTPEQIKEEIEISIKGLNQAIADGKAFKKIFYNTDFRYEDDARYSAVSKTVEVSFRNPFTDYWTAFVVVYNGTAIDNVCNDWEFDIYCSYISVEGYSISAEEVEEYTGKSFDDIVSG